MNRHFDFERDTFAFANDVNLPCRTRSGVEKRRIYRRCEGFTRAWLQFWKFARFESGEKLPLEEVVRRTKRVLRQPVYKPAFDEERRIVLPGYTGLREFSRENVEWLPWKFNTFLRTHFYPGIQRMIYPFSQKGQELAANRIQISIRNHEPIAAHLSHFPRIALNHFVICFNCREDAAVCRFDFYDPNRPGGPLEMQFDKQLRRFIYPRTPQFEGGVANLLIPYRNFLW
jgi:hypothetical protein